MRALLFCVAAAGLLGSAMAAGAGPPPVKPAAAKTAAAPDAEIERNIRQRFAKSKIAVNGFRVRVLGGLATIDGKTEVVQHKGVATRLARLGGAKSVDNRIEIGEAGRAKARASLAAGRRQARPAEPRSTPRSETRMQVFPAPRTATPAAPAVPSGPRRAIVRWP